MTFTEVRKSRQNYEMIKLLITLIYFHLIVWHLFKIEMTVLFILKMRNIFTIKSIYQKTGPLG